MTLKIWTNGTDFVIAESAQDALSIQVEDCGYETVEQYKQDTDESEADWSPLDDTALFPFSDELDNPLHENELKLEPGDVLRRRGEKVDADAAKIIYDVNDNGLVVVRTRKKLVSEWIAEMGRGYFASTEY